GATVAAITADGGRALALQGDVTRQDDVERLVARTVKAFGPVSILVNNANVRSYRPLMEITREEWRDTLAPTLDGSFFCIKACVPHMRRLGRGTIVNIGSASAPYGPPPRVPGAAPQAGGGGAARALAPPPAPPKNTGELLPPRRPHTPPPPAGAPRP